MTELLVRFDDGPVMCAEGALTFQPRKQWNLTVRHHDRYLYGQFTLAVQHEDTLWRGPGMVVAVSSSAAEYEHTVVSCGEMLTLDLTKLDDRCRMTRPNP